MDNENASCAYDGEENAQLSPLQRLPVEIFLHICSFLDGSTLVHGLSLVCTRFYLILKDANSLWKARINHIWPDASYPLLPPARPDKLCWMLSYVAIKQETALWKQQESREKRLFIEKIPGTTVDAVLLMHVNGISHLVYTNDQDLLYKQLPLREKLSHEIENSAGIAKAHQWQRIMDLTTIDNTIYSCGADNTVKSWVLTNTGLVHQRTYNLQRSDRLHSFFQCVSSCPERDLFATGSSCGTIYVFDSRSRNNPIRHYRPHTTYVKRLAMNTEYILSLTTYGKTVSVWDQRAGRTMKSITFPGTPMCINIRRDLVFVGAGTYFHSKLHVLNLKNDFELVKSYSTEHTKYITRMLLTHGCLITSSMDGTVRISSLTDPPKPIATLRSEIGYIYNMDYLNGTLAVSGDGIEVWCPKLTCSTKQQ
ncbi:F-box/WD repeat-containing protein 9-like isoform X2 [Temnothorax nylanderi]|uniref:F-box/WD repeat-containing protein 9-like isoform X2 n=1 Tax=Temnothorax nylanderi TaxID=102681 RepID=UPI003A846617